MSHEFERGFTVREAAWHGLATILAEYPGREEAMKVAGHNFRVLERKLAEFPDAQNLLSGNVGYQPIEGWKALKRDDTGDIISVVKDSYEVVQNSILWDIIDLMVAEPNVKYETAGVLRKGAVLWVLAKLDEPIVIPGDNSEIYPYVKVSTAHDGTGGIEAGATTVRIVCMNTFQMADTELKKSGLSYKFKHTKNVKVKIDEAKAAIGLVKGQFHEFQKLATELAGTRVTSQGINDFLKEFIPDPPAAIETERIMRNIEEAREKVRGILNGKTIAEAHRKTAYGLFESGIEYLDHIRKYHTPETYFRRTVLDRNTMKGRIAKLAMKVAG